MATGETKKTNKHKIKPGLAEVNNGLNEVWRGKKAQENEVLGRLYYSNNTVALKDLSKDESIKGKVKLIYIDPPYATNQVFVTRSRKGGYEDLITGSEYLKSMRECLVMLHELLDQEGSIYVHLDDNMAFEVKILMDEVFGKDNFRNFIVRKKCNPKNYTKKQFGNIADYILFYSKSKEYIWNRPYSEWSAEDSDREYTYIEAETGRRYKKVPIHAPGTRNGDTGLAWKGLNPPPGKHWQYKRSTLDELDAKGEIYWSSNGNPRRKVYLDTSKGIPIQDIWLDVKDAHNQNIKITGYPTEKNPNLLERIVSASSNPGDIVLDCFAGSGTTLGAAAKLGRRWIGIDNSLDAIDATLTRFIHGLQPMGDFVATSKVAQASLLEDYEASKILDTMVFYSSASHVKEAGLGEQLDRLNKVSE
jgi:adenine-specific DNA-methyltransferase